MKILFVHQNFPGQFPRLSKALALRGHQVLALTSEENTRPSPVQVVRYRAPDLSKIGEGQGQFFSKHAERCARITIAARQLRDAHHFTPDVIVGHSGWGEVACLKEVWPDTRLIVYSEMMFRSSGMDVGFDPEFAPADPLRAAINMQMRQAHLIHGFVQADQVITPTQFQADSHPPMLRPYIRVMHDGIDSDRIRPDPQARYQVPGGPELAAGDEVLTYVSRSLEPYRGFHILMRALPDILAARPDAQVLLVGGEGQSYGSAPPDGGSWKARALAEQGDRLDLSRVHFLDRIDFPDYIRVLQISRLHVYLTYPFVLSWSALEAMAAGCQIVASDTAPVREVMRDGETARLVDFFDVPGLVRAACAGLADPAPGRARGMAARDYVRAHYGLDRCLNDLIALVETPPAS